MKKRLVLLLVTAMAATTVLAGCGSKDSGSHDSGKKSAKEAEAVVVEEATQSVSAKAEDVTDDTELVAVIAAAIAEYEGTGTDGFVVRSIRRRPSNKWNA